MLYGIYCTNIFGHSEKVTYQLSTGPAWFLNQPEPTWWHDLSTGRKPHKQSSGGSEQEILWGTFQRLKKCLKQQVFHSVLWCKIEKKGECSAPLRSFNFLSKQSVWIIFVVRYVKVVYCGVTHTEICLTLKTPRKKCIWKWRLLKSSAANKCLA